MAQKEKEQHKYLYPGYKYSPKKTLKRKHKDPMERRGGKKKKTRNPATEPKTTEPHLNNLSEVDNETHITSENTATDCIAYYPVCC